MNAAVCPDAGTLVALLESEHPEGVTEYAAHLDTCVRCRQRLAELAADDASWKEAARYLPGVGSSGPGSLPASEPGLERLLVQLKAEPPFFQKKAEVSLDEEAALSFLRQAERPGLLGYLGDYEVQEVIGRGGMGVVFKAFDPALHRLVAIKIMAGAVAGSATARRRFAREAQAAAAVAHEHIVTVYGVFERDGLPFLVTQYVAGESLQTRLERAGPLAVVDIIRIGLQTASGLAAAHAQGLIHRDIKPANLLLENGLARVRITDFGLARMADDVQLTQQGVVAGTPEYMAPEQARGEPVDPRADLFSLGSVLYAACTGGPPFCGASAVAVLRQVSDREPVPIQRLNPAIPDWLEMLIARLMAKNPAERFQSAAEVVAILGARLARLEQPQAGLPPAQPLPPGQNASQPTSSDERPRAPRRFGRLPWFLLFLFLGILAAAGWGLFSMFPGGNDQNKPAGENDKPEKQEKQEHVAVDFRRGLENYPYLSPIGPAFESVATTDARGLHIKLAADRENTDRLCLEWSWRLQGNFDIVLGYELLLVGEPVPQYGAGLGLRLWFESPAELSASLSRRRRPNGERFGAHRILRGPDDKEQYLDNKDEKANRIRGQLRFTRTGSQVQYLVAEEGEKPRLIQSLDIGPEDVQKLQVSCDTMYTHTALEVRFTELDIRADKIPNWTVPASSATPLTPAEKTERNLWLPAAELLGLGLTLTLACALGIWLYLRHSRRETMLADVPVAPAKQGTSLAPVPVISFACAACGKNLKAQGELGGKKVKCTKCGQAVLVPVAAG